MRNKYLIFIGCLDLVSLVYSAFSYGFNGLFDRIADEFFAGRDFGFGVQFVYVLGLLLLFSFLVSGVFMILERRLGVVVSLVQAPFRFIMVIPPSLYLFMVVFGGARVVILMVILFEIAKTSYLVKWMMRSHSKLSSTSGRR